MKIFYFINPQKKVLSIIPHFLKKIYIKKGYYLLPNNKFFREIIIFFYIKILRKILITMELLFKVKFIWKNPKHYKYIIFDDQSLGIIDKILPPKEFFVLTTRIVSFKELYVTKDIIVYILKNLFKNKLKINYICCLIKLIKPKKIITIIDNSVDFHLIYKLFNKSNISFYAIQNAVRDQNYLKSILSISNYSGNYFCFGNYELDSINSNIPKKSSLKLKPVGSLKIELAKEYLFRENKKDLREIYDICLISEAGSEIDTSGSLNMTQWKDDQKVAARILSYTLSFCKKHNKKLLFLGKHNLENSENELVKEEEYLFYKYENDVENFDLQFFNKSKYDNIKNLLKSKVVIGQTSTLLRESFGLKKKILVCDWGSRKIKKSFNTDAFPENSIIKLKSDKYPDFEKRLMEILNMNYSKYLSQTINPKLIYNLDFKTLEFLRGEMKK